MQPYPTHPDPALEFARDFFDMVNTYAILQEIVDECRCREDRRYRPRSYNVVDMLREQIRYIPPYMYGHGLGSEGHEVYAVVGLYLTGAAALQGLGATGSSAGAGGGAATVPYPASAGAGSQTLLPAASVGGAAVTVGVGATLDPEDTRAYPR